ncbi:MAG: rod shape-determining protein MreC [Patiriisocius sp.]|jgi:rod shape-determining protein MreC
MRSLIKLLRKYQLFLLFLILQLVSFNLIFKYNSFPKATFLSSTNSMVGLVSKKSAEIAEFLALQEINDALVEENNKLRENSKLSFHKVNDEYALIDDSLWRKQYRFSYADIVQSSIYQSNNYITLDKGESSKVEPGMGVLSTNGIIGKVIKCTKNYSLVMPVINGQFTLNVVALRTGNSGLLTWKEEHDFRYARVENITKDTPLEKGDVFVTRTGSKLFPGGVEIGKIVEVFSSPGDNFHTIRILMNTDYGRIKKATLVFNILKPEIDELEEAKIDD